MFLGVPVLALTATADKSTQETICSQLWLQADHTKTLISPNRKNLRLSVLKVKKESMVTQLDWLVEEVKQKGGDMPKTIIFCYTIRDIAIVINLLLLKLGEYALTELSNGSANNAFDGVLEHCFSSELVEDIVKNCQYLFSIQDITERNLPVYSFIHCLKILEVIQEIFEDIPNFDSAMNFFAHSADACKQFDTQYDNYFMDVFEQPDDDTHEYSYII